MPLSCSDCCHMPTVKNRRGAKVLKYQLCFCLFVWFRCRHLTRWFKAPFTPNFYTQSLSQVIENQHEDLDQGWTGLSSFPNPDRSLPIKCLVLYRHTDPKTPENPIKTDYFSLLKTSKQQKMVLSGASLTTRTNLWRCLCRLVLYVHFQVSSQHIERSRPDSLEWLGFITWVWSVPSNGLKYWEVRAVTAKYCVNVVCSVFIS